MFRIHTKRGPESTCLTIEGKLTGPWVSELEKCWRDEFKAEPVKPIVVNLASVFFVDASGRALLSRMRRQGAKFVARGRLMKALVEEIESGLSNECSANEVA